MQPIDKKRSKKGKKVYLPLAQAIRTVCFCGPNATMARASSGIRNCANDHSELKYLGNTPFMNEREEPAFVAAYDNKAEPASKRLLLEPARCSELPLETDPGPKASARASSDTALIPNT
jgi:hypothetical protein